MAGTYIARQKSVDISVIEGVREGASPTGLPRAFDITACSVWSQPQKYSRTGEEPLKAKPIPGRPPKLTGKQISWIADTVRETNRHNCSCPLPCRGWRRSAN